MNTENNIKIALHIEMQKTYLGWFDHEEVLIQAETDNTFDDLKFDTDWNWLLAVVCHLSQEHDRNEDKDFDVVCYEVSDAVLVNDITRAFNSVVKFIDIILIKNKTIMNKVAKLVYVTLATRVIVEEGTSVEDILSQARQKFIDKIENELNENLEDIVVDRECPYSINDVCEGDKVIVDGINDVVLTLGDNEFELEEMGWVDKSLISLN